MQCAWFRNVFPASLHSEDGGGTFLRNVGNDLESHTQKTTINKEEEMGELCRTQG